MREWIETHAPTIAVAVASVAVGAFAATAFARPTPAPIEIRTREAVPSPTTTLFVHVEGAVPAPGVYRLPADARVFEAIDAAGGALDEAEVSGLNLAARIADGQKLVIPARAAAFPSGSGTANGVDASSPAGAAVSGPAALAPGSTLSSNARINVNTASQRVLESLPGIGPVTATNIIQYRQTNGPFTRVEQLRDARIVNASTYERIKDLVTV